VVLVETVAFFTLFRSGWNLRFADPSLTTELIVASMVTLATFMYFVPAARAELDVFYLVILLFGLLHLGIRRMLVLALVAFVSHATMLLAWHLNNPHTQLWPSITQLAVLALVLPWFAVMGGYVSNLRNRLKDSNHELTLARDRIEQIAIRDTLTGIFNRRHLLEVLEHEISRAQRSRTPLSVALMDIDHFKRINDKMGHATGDQALKHFVAVAQSAMRTDDVFGRYGGEEFLLIMPNTGDTGAGPAAERIRVNVETAPLPEPLRNYRFTVTAGVSVLAPGEDAASLLERADRGLYRGKGAGRNRVVVMDPNPLRSARR
jgi:diguanylate cyclase (GGDEF)-like protein